MTDFIYTPRAVFVVVELVEKYRQFSGITLPDGTHAGMQVCKVVRVYRPEIIGTTEQKCSLQEGELVVVPGDAIKEIILSGTKYTIISENSVIGYVKEIGVSAPSEVKHEIA